MAGTFLGTNFVTYYIHLYVYIYDELLEVQIFVAWLKSAKCSPSEITCYVLYTAIGNVFYTYTAMQLSQQLVIELSGHKSAIII